MEIRLLGPLEVIAAGEVVPLGGRRERALLAIMALSPEAVLSSDRLIDALWGEDLPANPANALQALISRLRRSLGSDVIVTQAPGYLLDVAPEAIDAVRFRKAVAAAAAATDPGERSERYREALGLWRGDALTDFSMEEFAQREIAALEELRLLAIERRVAADLEAGAGPDLVPEVEELVAAHPLRESLRASQMLALYRAGRQADALRAYRMAQEVLGRELGIEPGPELRAMEEAVLMQEPELGAAGSPARDTPSLPARLASFIGRTDELRRVGAAFDKSRLVTLTGPGGAGKTSLAIEAARQLADRYADGVWLVELAPISEPSRVDDALLEALHLGLGGSIGAGRDVAPLRAVVEYLRRRRALLVVDNCEHVIDAAAAAIEAMLLACPNIDVLATSRDRLGTPGEVLWRVPPLGWDDGAPGSDAVTLFLERARAVNRGFDPTPYELDRIVDICRKVDGMPLAIELAAARTRALPVGEIADRLATGIDVLSRTTRGTDRQRTLEATIDWSFALLGGQDRELLARLSVFHGSFTLDAAEAVAPEGWAPSEVLEAIERLIDASMLNPMLVDTGRYRMLETLRLYAGARLAELGAAHDAMRRVLDYFVDELAPAEDALRGPDQLLWLDRIEADIDSVRSVLDWAVDHDPARGLRLAGMMGWFWYLQGSGSEAQERLGGLLSAAKSGVGARDVAHARFFLGLHQPHPENALSAFEAAGAGYAEVGDDEGVAQSLAMLAAWGSDRAETRALLEQAESRCVAAGHEWGAALIRFLQAGAAAVRNDIAASGRLAEEAVQRFAAVGDRWGQGYSLYTLGVAKRALGDYAAATEALRAALDHARPMRLRREMAPVMSELASIATMQGDLDRAAELLAEARRFADEVPFAGSQGMVRNAQGRLALRVGDTDTAKQLHHEAIALYQESGNPGGLAYSYSCMGFAEETAGELAAAQEHHVAALRYAQESGDVFAVALGLEGLGSALVASGQMRRGATLIAAGLAARERAGVPLPHGERPETDRALEMATAVTGASAVEAAIEAGRRLGLEAAIDFAGAANASSS